MDRLALIALALAKRGGGGGTNISPYASDPAMDGTASAGSSDDYARGDHVHPSDTSKYTFPDGGIPASDLASGVIPDISGKADAPTEVTVADNGAVTQACADNTIYTFTGTLTSLTLTESSGAHEYIVIFSTGSTAPTVTPPTGVVLPDGTNTFTAEANKRYEISVRNGYAVYASWAVS